MPQPDMAAQAEGFVDPAVLAQVKAGRDYVAAKFGFRNHWYPAMFSRDIGEGTALPVELLGEKILLRRIRGTVHAIRDQCVHRGVPFSRKIECYTPDTVTCWYHGFTYRFSDGVLCDILGTNHSAVIGDRRVRTYAVTEAKGLVFVFVGDEDHVPPPLAHDVPPMFLDEDLAVCGIVREVAANWRIGCENGFDSTHIFIHKNSPLVEGNSLMLPLGLVPNSRKSFERVEDADGPKGVYDLFGPDAVQPVFEGRIAGQTVLTGHTQGTNILPHHISMWLPCALRVHPWPDPTLTQFEWYVPIDGARHLYFQMLGQRVSAASDAERFAADFESRWKGLALHGFNDDDVWAREATEPFYADDTGWLREQLFEPDGNIIAWRLLASRHHRGLQHPRHIR